MYYRRLLLDDFGIFQRAELDGLEPGLTVIGGPQRAGKTTFMEAARRLGYGISQGDEVPPPSDTYRLGAELTYDDAPYRLNLEGYGEPYLSPLTQGDDSVPQRTTKDVFGALSKQQYHQLYTLSLDQLQRLPPTIEEPEDLSRVLLGAAYGSLADLPQIKEEFGNRAHAIGRKTGHPRYGQFGDAFEQIQGAQDELQAANEQVGVYDETRKTLSDVEKQLGDQKVNREALNREQRRLNVVQQFFDDFRTYRRLGEDLSEFNRDRRKAFPEDGLKQAKELRERFKAADSQATDAAKAFRAETSAGDAETQSRTLQAVTEKLDTYRTEVAGWRERRNAIVEEAADLEDEQTELKTQIRRLRDDWDGTFEEIKTVGTDLVSRDKVSQTVDRVTEARKAAEEAERELEGKRKRKAEIETQLDGLETEGDSRQGLLIATGGGVVGVLAAIGLAVAVNAVTGVIVGALLVLGGAAVAFRRSKNDTNGRSQRDQLQAQKSTLEQDIAELQEQHQQAETELAGAETKLERLREQLGVEDGLSPKGVIEFHEDVTALREEIDDYEQQAKRHAEKRKALADELREVADTVGRVRTLDWNGKQPLERADRLFEAVDQAVAEADLAREWELALEERTAIHEEAIAFVESWGTDKVTADDLEGTDPERVLKVLDTAVTEGERLAEAAEYRKERQEIERDIRARFRQDAVHDAFASVHEPPANAGVDEWYLKAFESVADQFADAVEVGGRLDEIDERISEIEAERDKLQERRAELKQKLEELASEDDLIEAREQLQEGARTIEQLGEEYGTYRIAEYITERLQDQFIEDMTGPLMEEASEIFARITAEYDGVGHTGELEDLDFEVFQDGEAVMDRSELSRATTEQLFIAVRLARIRQIETPLPVVLDDTLTNFDPAHSARTMGLIDELARTHQVFFLTAHPAFITRANEYADVAQFWRVDDGRFDGPFNEPESVITDLELTSMSLD